jgi:hypothetical protein
VGARIFTRRGSVARTIALAVSRTNKPMIENILRNISTALDLSPKAANSIFEEVNSVLASTFGFTCEDLGFILNYDMKYRFGLDPENEEE